MNDTRLSYEFSVNIPLKRAFFGCAGKIAVVKKTKICYNNENIMESMTFSQ
jgi:hypothetical protein